MRHDLKELEGDIYRLGDVVRRLEERFAETVKRLTTSIAETDAKVLRVSEDVELFGQELARLMDDLEHQIASLREDLDALDR